MYRRLPIAPTLLVAIASLVFRVAPALAQSGKAAAIDSIQLERTLCYGSCPAYSLHLDLLGRIRFLSLNPGDSGRTAHDSIGSGGLLFLQHEAERIGFLTLPDKLVGTPLCADLATDHPTATVTLFLRQGAKRVVDYRGCFERADHSVRPIVAQLRMFEQAIDSVTRSYRWVRPARRR